jgi:cell division protein FtsL
VTGRAAARAAVPAPASPRSRGGARATAPRPELRVLSTASAPVRAGRRTAPATGSRRAPFVLLLVALLVGTTLGLLFLNTAIAVDSLKATQLRTQNTERSQEVERLEQQVVSSDAPGRLADAAAGAGLIPAGTPGHLVIGPDGKVVLRGTPEPAAPPSADPDGD